MAFCSKCGAEIPEGAGYCVKCGARADGGKGTKEKNPVYRTLAIITALVLLLGVGCPLVFRRVIRPAVFYSRALENYANGNYEDALTTFEYLKNYKDSARYADMCSNAMKDGEYGAAYDEAVSLFNSGRYEEAKYAFAALNGYGDSALMITRCDEALAEQSSEAAYNEALALYEAGRYEEAKAAFEALGSYKDSENMAYECSEENIDFKYKNAVDLYESGDYNGAIALFRTVPSDYKKCSEYIYTITNKHWELLCAGDIFTYGTYEQDANKTNDKEDIEWIVLDRQGTSMLVVSRYVLDAKVFNNKMKDVTWEESSIRSWLNNAFFEIAFNQRPTRYIMKTEVPADDNEEYDTDAGRSTTDRIFLLSSAEVEKYFPDYSAACKATQGAKANGVFVDENNGYAWWWLRTTAHSGSAFEVVGSNGSGSYKGFGEDVNTVCGVRPAMWITLD